MSYSNVSRNARSSHLDEQSLPSMKINGSSSYSPGMTGGSSQFQPLNAMKGTYNYTVKELLKAAGMRHTPRNIRPAGPGRNIDHVVELQLIAAALNHLPRDTYNKVSDWQNILLQHFNNKESNPSNFQYLEDDANEHKGQIVTKLIAGAQELTPVEEKQIDVIRRKWNEIKLNLGGFGEFKMALDSILGPVSGGNVRRAKGNKSTELGEIKSKGTKTKFLDESEAEWVTASARKSGMKVSDPVSRNEVQIFLKFEDKTHTVSVPEICEVEHLLKACLKVLPRSFTLENLRILIPALHLTVAKDMMANSAPLKLSRGMDMHVVMSLPGGATNF